MSTASLWWKECLEARCPLRCESLWSDGYNVKTTLERPGPWPKAVARQALLSDYQVWFEEKFLPSYKETGFFVDHPDRMPKPMSEMEFFVAIGPLIYLNGKGKDVKNYFVKEPRMFEGKWLQVKVRRYFVRLGEWEDHVRAFEVHERQPIRRREKDLVYT